MNVANSDEAAESTPRTAPSEGIASLADLRLHLHQFDGEAVSRAVDRVFETDMETRPTFSSSWVAPLPPPDALLVRTYRVGDSEVRLYNLPEAAESLYFVVPSEYQLPIHHLTRRCGPRSRT